MQINLLKVYDGDTLLVEKGNFTYKVRLSRIDAPELGQPFLLANRDAGDYSRQCLKRVAKKSGTLIIYGFDIYGRILGDVDDLSLKMVQQGCAPLYPYAGFRSKAEKFHFIRQLQMAKRKKKGLWSLGGIMQPKLYRKQTKKFSKRVSHLQSHQ
jgi:endonuclease YncB( thermonuclease family)